MLDGFVFGRLIGIGVIGRPRIRAFGGRLRRDFGSGERNIFVDRLLTVRIGEGGVEFGLVNVDGDLIVGRLIAFVALARKPVNLCGFDVFSRVSPMLLRLGRRRGRLVEFGEIAHQLFFEIDVEIAIVERRRGLRGPRIMTHDARQFGKGIIVRKLGNVCALVIAVCHLFPVLALGRTSETSRGVLRFWTGPSTDPRLALTSAMWAKGDRTFREPSASRKALPLRSTRARMSGHPTRPAPALAWHESILDR